MGDHLRWSPLVLRSLKMKKWLAAMFAAGVFFVVLIALVVANPFSS